MRSMIALVVFFIGLALWVNARAQSAHVASASPQATSHAEMAPTPSSALTPLEIIHGPVVEYVSSHHAVISWITNASSSTLLKYGASKSNLTLSGHPGLALARKNHRVEISKLKPNTTYYFRATSALKKEGTVTSNIGEFKTTGRGDRPVRMPQSQ